MGNGFKFSRTLESPFKVKETRNWSPSFSKDKMEEVNNETVLVSTQLTLTSSQLSPSNPLPLSLSVLKDSNIRAYKRRMAEMAEKFLEENIKNGLQPRIFPVRFTLNDKTQSLIDLSE